MIRFKEHLLENIGGYLVVGFFFLVWAFNSNLLKSNYEIGYEGLNSGEYHTALDYLIPLAMEGDMQAMYYLGHMYGAGKGVEEDKEIAFKLYKKSADKGNPNSQYALGYMYHKGEFVPQDIDKAISYYKMANTMSAIHYLSELYYENNIISDDIIAWYKQTAERNYQLSQFNLGEIYYTGEHMPQDFKKAAHWYRRAIIGASKHSYNMMWRTFKLDDIKKKCEHIRGLENKANTKEMYREISDWYHNNGRGIFRLCLE